MRGSIVDEDPYLPIGAVSAVAVLSAAIGGALLAGLVYLDGRFLLAAGSLAVLWGSVYQAGRGWQRLNDWWDERNEPVLLQVAEPEPGPEPRRDIPAPYVPTRDGRLIPMYSTFQQTAPPDSVVAVPRKSVLRERAYQTTTGHTYLDDGRLYVRHDGRDYLFPPIDGVPTEETHLVTRWLIAIHRGDATLGQRFGESYVSNRDRAAAVKQWCIDRQWWRQTSAQGNGRWTLRGEEALRLLASGESLTWVATLPALRGLSSE